MRSRRRSSLPSVPTDIPTRKPAPSYARAQTASPEVISSLIDSLSTLSASTLNAFESLPATGSSSPTSPTRQSQFGEALALPNENGPDPAAYYQALVTNTYDYPDDACEPPVIRTARTPSGLSPITAPKRKDKEHSLKSYMSRGGGSSASVQSVHSARSASSFGAISIERGPPRASNASNRTSSDSKRSSRGKSLLFMSSREQLRVKEAERKRATIHSSEALGSAESIWKPGSHLVVSQDIIKEEPIVSELSGTLQAQSSRGNSPLSNRYSLFGVADGADPSEKGLIPERASSLRHSGSPSRKSRKKPGRKTSRHDPYKTGTVPEEDEIGEPEKSSKDRALEDLAAEEDEVAKRIEELRKQKYLRDKIAGKLPVGLEAAGASAGAANVSPIPSLAPSPTLSVSSASEKRARDPAKAHKVLGISLAPTPEPRTSQDPETQDARPNIGTTGTAETPKRMQHTRSRSLTVNDSVDLTPLPIDYMLALETLEAPAFTPPGSSSASFQGTVSSTTALDRSRSLAVGGRSAVGRRARSSMVMGESPRHKHSTSITGGTRGNNTVRSASEEVAPRKLSLTMQSPAASPSPQRRPTLKKKRWSHPDLPAKAEKAHNDRVDAMNAAHRALQPAIEERPTSMDSIDMDVDKYLHSARLSQRIRHPQTGRIISFSDVGDPNGCAVFVCVGMGLTRYVMAFYDQLAATLKLRLITPERPGIGMSQADPNGTPLSWPDDILVICQALKITKFSLLAHSAGAIYALATSLRMPQHIRGRVHLLAPWIPPSQMAPIGVSQDQPPQTQLPRSQRFLRTLPPSLLKIANSTFLSATSASIQRTVPKNSPKTKRKATNPQFVSQEHSRPPIKDTRRESIMLMDQILPNPSSLSLAPTNTIEGQQEDIRKMKDALTEAERRRKQEFDERLTFAIWDRATANANPATDLIVCLETKQTIGFRYEDINRAVVIHHGSKDSRVPVDNVRWLGRLMRRCEVRILEGEQHGLMASAQVMGNVLTEIASEWQDWNDAVSKTTDTDRSLSRRRTAERLRLS
ncbi:alpha/beta-hydrolase [Sporormia fimetaria CBS 119925]|uniref:Alpha/beta-hydrolase n=1 Tax=Sporormia fimetaria CBS 119925 TaxID=1340428 RepID=A0A6A6VID2_9PLEO|nr:alpha/beta-hydrolase [Sporormia fimetaria CBS 119925]